MKIAIVDDERKASALLEGYIDRFKEENSIVIHTAVYNNPNDFLTQYKGDVDLILMDIEMPGLNGIETAKELRRIDSRVVLMFITNMAQYALQGYEVEAVDYVIKPLSYADFSMKMKKAMRYITLNSGEDITLKTSDRIVKVNVLDIIYVEVIRHYLIYHTTRGEVTVRSTMKETEEMLTKYSFVRSHNCYLINLKYVEAIEGNFVRLAGEELAVSRKKKSELLTEFARYVGGIKK